MAQIEVSILAGSVAEARGEKSGRTGNDVTIVTIGTVVCLRWAKQRHVCGFVRANGGGGPIGSQGDLKPNSPALILNVQCLTSRTGLKQPLAASADNSWSTQCPEPASNLLVN